MKVKTSEAEGEVLNYLVAKCEGYFDIDMASVHEGVTDVFYFPRWQPSTDWAQGGPIIERERICLIDQGGDYWQALWGWKEAFAPTPLIAAMRCYVASKLGDEVEIPEELK
jgi:hypothetical protein